MTKDFGSITISENGTMTLPEKLMKDLDLKSKEDRTFVVCSNGASIILGKPICIRCGKKKASCQRNGIGFCEDCMNQMVLGALK